MNSSQLQELEIDLKELFKVLWNKKLFIIVFTLFVIISTQIYMYLKPPVYKAKAIIKIGEYRDDEINSKLLDDADTLKAELKVLFIDIKHDNVASIESISTIKNNSNFLIVSALAISNEHATRGIKSVIKYLQNKHLNKLNEVKALRSLELRAINNQIENIERRINTIYSREFQNLQNQINEYKKYLKQLNNDIKEIEAKNIQLATLRILEKSNILKSLIVLEDNFFIKKEDLNKLNINKYNLVKKSKSLEELLLPQNYINTSIIGKIVTSNEPVQLNKILVIFISFIIGVLVSILLIFVNRFIDEVKIH